MAKQTSYTFKLSKEEQTTLVNILKTGNYRPATLEHTIIAATGTNCNIALYKSGKCLVQGKGSEDFVLFVMEPLVLHQAQLGYEEIQSPEMFEPHMGIDESGKGDFFGPIVIASVYVDKDITAKLRDMGLRESKAISSDKRVRDMARELRKHLNGAYSLVTIGPSAYNKLYAKMRNVNRMLAWAHARAIENLLEKVPSCPMAISDQFGAKEQVEKALMSKGRSLKLVQRHKAESDPAVAAASVLAREAFINAMAKLEKRFEQDIPKGASAAVQQAAGELAKKHKPAILLEVAKCHFKTTDKVLAELGEDRSCLGPEGAATSKAFAGRGKKR
jgi:ribonuclease HIII